MSNFTPFLPPSAVYVPARIDAGCRAPSTRLARVCPMWESLGMRPAADYVASLRDGRAVFLDGERVADVTTHPAFAEPIRRVAERYEAARQAPDVTECVDPASGRRIGAMWLILRSAEDLGRRRAVHLFWAEGSYGLMGRTPDHVASVLTGFAGWRQLFNRAASRSLELFAVA